MNATRRICLLLALLTILTAGFPVLFAPFSALAEEDGTGGESPSASPEDPPPVTSPSPSPAVTQSDPPVSTPTPTVTATPPTPTATPTPTPTATPTATPTPMPTLKPYIVRFFARDVTFEQWELDEAFLSVDNPAGDANRNRALLGYVSAVDENDRHVAVTIYDPGGFNPYEAKEYRVEYRALHPVTMEAFFTTITITVTEREKDEEEPEEGEAEEEVVPFVKDQTSNARYRKYLSYRNSIQKKLTEIMEQLDADFNERVHMIKSAFPGVENVKFARRVGVDQDEGDEGEMTQLLYVDEPDIKNWSQVLPVFVAASSMKVKKPLDLYNLRSLPLEPLINVFWDMREWSYVREGDDLTLVLHELDYDAMIERYGLDAKTVDKLEELMQPEFQMLFAALTRDDTFTDLSESDISAIRASLPGGITMQREQIVLTAHTLVDQIKYFWGGKYTGVGWNPLWGVERVVEAENSETTGTLRPYGMDCSGFVAWVFVNAAKDSAVAEAIGTGTSIQWSNSRPLGWDEAIPGDLAFFTRPGKKNHVGIIVEKRTDGTYLVAHCSSAKNTVVITEAWETGFRYMRRPALYEDA